MLWGLKNNLLYFSLYYSNGYFINLLVVSHSFWNPERALHCISLHVFLSPYHQPSAKQCPTWIFKNLFAVIVEKKSDQKSIWKAAKWNSRCYCPLHYYISKTGVPIRSGFVVHNWTNSKEQYLLWRFSTKKPWCYQKSHRDRICEQMP